MTKDTQKEPVTVEEDIASLIAAGEETEDDKEQPEAVEEEPEKDAEETAESPEEEDGEDSPDEGDEPETEVAEGEDSPYDEQSISDSDGDEQDEEPEDRLDAPEHWSAEDRETFTSVPREAQEFLLKRHKEMEGHFTRKNQELSDKTRQFDARRDSLAPYEQEFARSGLDYAGAVRQLAHWHNALRTDPNSAIKELAQTYGADLSDEDEEIDPNIRQIQHQLKETQSLLARQQQEAQRSEQEQILAKIQAFEAEKDESGKLTHPYFETLRDDITRLFQAGLTDSLEDGYKKALALRPDLRSPDPKPAPKVDQREKVKQAKKAATGVKSSGSVGKREKTMTIEEEIASLMT